MEHDCIGLVYIVIALIASGFYGFGAMAIFTEGRLRDLVLPKAIHQVWLNFAGAITGWVCLWFVLCKVFDNQPRYWDLSQLGWSYAGLAFVSFLGVTGFIPNTVARLSNSLGALVGKLAGLLEEKSSKKPDKQPDEN